MKQGTENGAAPNEAAGNQERIEEARQLAYDHGLPFSSRPSQGAEDDLDPYTYDASMTPEDFELMEAAMHAYAPPKWWHYYKHAKKSRVHKKYEHRIRDSMLAALAALREEGEGCRECITPAPSVAPI